MINVEAIAADGAYLYLVIITIYSDDP